MQITFAVTMHPGLVTVYTYILYDKIVVEMIGNDRDKRLEDYYQV